MEELINTYGFKLALIIATASAFVVATLIILVKKLYPQSNEIENSQYTENDIFNAFHSVDDFNDIDNDNTSGKGDRVEDDASANNPGDADKVISNSDELQGGDMSSEDMVSNVIDELDQEIEKSLAEFNDEDYLDALDRAEEADNETEFSNETSSEPLGEDVDEDQEKNLFDTFENEFDDLLNDADEMDENEDADKD